MKKATSGFTIVEILIVIVIIAILAMITLVTYNTVQKDARNAKVITALNTYRRALINYGTKNNDYPNFSGVCLGDSYPSNQCWVGTNGTYSVNSSLDSALSPYVGSKKPVSGTKYLQVTATDQRVGLAYLYTSPTNTRIIYYLEGQNQTCLTGDTATNEMETTKCTMLLPEP